MAKPKSSTTDPNKTEIISDILKVSTGTFECCILGNSPLILNRMSEKAKHELLKTEDSIEATGDPRGRGA